MVRLEPATSRIVKPDSLREILLLCHGRPIGRRFQSHGANKKPSCPVEYVGDERPGYSGDRLLFAVLE